MFLIRLLAPLIVAVLVYWGLRQISLRYSLTRQQFKWLVIIAAVLMVVLLLIIMGRLPVQALAAPAIFLMTFLLRNGHLLARWLPRARRQAGAGQGGSAQAADISTIRTAYLAMELHHSSGDMDGEVLSGSFQGQRLSQMSLTQLLELARECQNDADSQQLLQAYLDRTYPDWQEKAAESGQHRGGSGGESAMTEALALDILGLQPGAERKEVIAAHRKLMQKMHPDRGGSDYLAKKINEAKDFLISRQG